MSDFQQFMKQREAAASAYCRGEGKPVDALTTPHNPASFFGPDGKAVKGAKAVRENFDAGARNFGPSGESHFEIFDARSSGDVGYWTGLQHAEVEMAGKHMPMSLRVTELFRREAGEWKLVHRHADPLKA